MERLFGTAGQKEDVSMLFNPLLHVTLKSINVKDMKQGYRIPENYLVAKIFQKCTAGRESSSDF